MNAFFASCEQQERPELRGRPVIVAAVAAETTCALAVSYEAKAFGIKTGTAIHEARKLCPDLQVVAARPQVYLDYNTKIVEALNEHFVEVKALSVDEMACTISRYYSTPEDEIRLAQMVKKTIASKIGEFARCSIGIADNVFLAKVASDMHKPNGLTQLNETNMPDALFKLDLIDFPGIGPRMLVRLERKGITTTRQLWDSSRSELRRAWGSVLGERWWYMMRGSPIADYGVEDHSIHKTVGHSHIFPPAFRHRRGAQDIMLRLFSKAMHRLRRYGQVAANVEMDITYRHEVDFTTYSWRYVSRHNAHSNLESAWLKVVRPALDSLPASRFRYNPMSASIRFSDLLFSQDQTLNLFEDTQAHEKVWKTVDTLNAKGKAVDIASVFHLREQAPKRIPFGMPR